MPETPKPPKGASLLLRLFASEPDFPQVEGDLSEEFQQLALQAGPSTARQWYWREAVRNARAFVIRRGSINVLGTAVLSVCIFRLVMPWLVRWLRLELASMARVPGLGFSLITSFEITVSFVLGVVMSRILRRREPLLRLSFTGFYLVNVLYFIFRSRIYEWWLREPVYFYRFNFGLLFVITSFWIGSLCSERRARRLSLS